MGRVSLALPKWLRASPACRLSRCECARRRPECACELAYPSGPRVFTEKKEMSAPSQSRPTPRRARVHAHALGQCVSTRNWLALAGRARLVLMAVACRPRRGGYRTLLLSSCRAFDVRLPWGRRTRTCRERDLPRFSVESPHVVIESEAGVLSVLSVRERASFNLSCK